MEQHSTLKERELEFLLTEREKEPSLFTRRTFREDAEALSEFGIYIPAKDSCPDGYLKFRPEDFIVEEIAQDGLTRIELSHEKTDPETEVYPMLQATLVKCGLSTLEAVDEIGKLLKIEREQIAYAGMKDKDAITSQRITLRHVSRSALGQITSPHFFLKDIQVHKGAAQRGHLIGNRFTILVRTDPGFFMSDHADLFLRRLAAVKEHGFYNFFYLQRFSTPRLCNFVWARHILRGEYEQAVREYISGEGERELPYFRNIRRTLRAAFPHAEEMCKSIEPFPVIFRHERIMTEHLLQHPADYKGALQGIPDQVTIWMYALASLMFNQKISDDLMRTVEPPQTLPFFLSPDASDWEPYQDMMRNLQIYPPQFRNLQGFPQLVRKRRETPTTARVHILKAEIVDEGVILQFELGKGQYATTFLSHLFNLLSGAMPKNFPTKKIDSAHVLGENTLTPVFDRFADAITQHQNDIERSIGES